MPPEERGSKTFLPDGIFGPESEALDYRRKPGNLFVKR
jgi:hypothetical protein